MSYRSGRAAAGGHAGRRTGVWWRHLAAALALVAYLAAGITGARALWSRWQAARSYERGITFGPPPGPATDPWAVNVALEQYGDEKALARSLDLLASGGYHWVRQRFPWAEIEPERGSFRWEPWDAIVQECQVRGLRVIAVLDGSPGWARAPDDAANPFAPPRNPADLATFARAFASRYGASVDYYQIWDEPNIAPHWGARDPDPAGYLRLLCAARTQIRDVDPGAVLVAAGLAPTTEERGRNLSELLYLRGLYAAGGREFFDVVAGKPYGFWSGPDDRRVEAAILNFSRLVALHEEMVRQGDGRKPIWAVAWGWNALPTGWQGRPSPWGNDTAERQQARDLEAIARAREEWPWLGLMCYAAWQPAARADDPIWGLALLDRSGVPGTLFRRLQALSQAPQVLYPGRHPWPGGQGPVELRFWGSRVDLVGPGRWQLLALDGEPLAADPWSMLTRRERPSGRVLAAAEGRGVTAVHGLPAGEHRLLVAASGVTGATQVVVVRERPPLLGLWPTLVLAATIILATAGLWLLLRPYPWPRWFARGLAGYRQFSPWAALTTGGAGLALLAGAPGLAPSLVALGIVALLVAGRADVGLGLAAFLVPFAPLHKRFGPAGFSYLEIVTLLAVAAQFARDGRAFADAGRRRPLSQLLREQLQGALRQLNALDVGFALLVAASFLSLTASERLWVSLRELRVVILQAAFLYWLVARARLDRAGILHLADVLVLSATAISLQGLYQYVWTDRVIVAEGVRRIRGIYGSPNNLALVLGRFLPVMLAMALCGPRGRRRWLYGLAAMPTALCAFLTFSKGAWLVGLPASLLVLGILAGGWAGWAALGLVVAGAASLVPLLGTARLGSLFVGQGTTLLRIKLWEAAWDMVRDHPLRGVGLDNFLYQYPRYIRPEALSEPNLSHPHNFVLDFWLRLGLPGLFAFGWLEWSFFRQALGWLRRHLDPELRALTIGLVAGMVDMLAHGLIDASFFVVELAAIFALWLALARWLQSPETPET